MYNEFKQFLVNRQFYLREDVVTIARELLGKYLFTSFDGHITGGIISETEAYNGIYDKASHAWNGRRTARTDIMYRTGGTAYVYLCYGVHSLFNVVTNVAGVPQAVLIRSIIPVVGLDTMKERSGKKEIKDEEGTGPGRVTRLLGIHYSHTGLDLSWDENRKDVCNTFESKTIWIEDRKLIPDPADITTTTRIGVDYAGEDALLLYRFVWKKKRPPVEAASL